MGTINWVVITPKCGYNINLSFYEMELVLDNVADSILLQWKALFNINFMKHIRYKSKFCQILLKKTKTKSPIYKAFTLHCIYFLKIYPCFEDPNKHQWNGSLVPSKNVPKISILHPVWLTNIFLYTFKDTLCTLLSLQFEDHNRKNPIGWHLILPHSIW